MATSGSTDWSLTSRQVITEAFEAIGVIDIGGVPAAEDAAKALSIFNQQIKTWGIEGRLWIKTEGSVTLVAATASYSVPLARRILSVRRRTSAVDTPLIELSRQEYFDYPSKAAPGMPFQFYFDPQRATHTLYVINVPDAAVAASTTLPYTYLRVIEDADTLDNDPDFPQEWMETLIYGLAARLIVPYRVQITNPALSQEVKERAAALYAMLSADDDESTSVFFQPA